LEGRGPPGACSELWSETAGVGIGNAFKCADFLGPRHADWVSSLHIGDNQGFGILRVKPREHVLSDQVRDFIAPVVELLFPHLEGNSIERDLGWPLIVGEKVAQ